MAVYGSSFILTENVHIMKTTNYIKLVSLIGFAFTLSGTALAENTNANFSKVTKEIQARADIPYTLLLTLTNTQGDIIPVAGLRVDIWYLQQNGSAAVYSNQPVIDETKNTINTNWLKSTQYTDGNGQVSFTVNYPQWTKPSGSPIKIQIYDKSNALITTTQFTFPITVNTAVIPVGGYRAAQTIAIPAGTFIDENPTISIGQISNLKTYPNPVTTYTTFAFELTQQSDVEIMVGDLSGTQIKTFYSSKLPAGQNEIEVDLSGLAPGIYFYRLQLDNQKGTFSQSQKLVKI
jgi:hypothetical protein